MSENRQVLIEALMEKYREIAAIPIKDLSWSEGRLQIEMMVSIAGCVNSLERKPHHHHHHKPPKQRELPEEGEEAIVIIEEETALF